LKLNLKVGIKFCGKIDDIRFDKQQE
jgi:hypothetical protein